MEEIKNQEFENYTPIDDNNSSNEDKSTNSNIDDDTVLNVENIQDKNIVICEKCGKENKITKNNSFCKECGWPLNQKYIPPKTPEEKLEKYYKTTKKHEKKVRNQPLTYKFNVFYAICIIFFNALGLLGTIYLSTISSVPFVSFVPFLLSIGFGVLLLIKFKPAFVFTIIKGVFSVLLSMLLIAFSVSLIKPIKDSKIENFEFKFNQKAAILSCSDKINIKKEILKKYIFVLKDFSDFVTDKKTNTDKKAKDAFNEFVVNTKNTLKTKEPIAEQIANCETDAQLLNLAPKLVNQYVLSVIISLIALLLGVPSIFSVIINVFVILYYSQRLRVQKN